MLSKMRKFLIKSIIPKGLLQNSLTESKTEIWPFINTETTRKIQRSTCPLKLSIKSLFVVIIQYKKVNN